MKSEIAILIWLTQGFQKCKVFEFSTIGLRAKAKMSENLVLCSVPLLADRGEPLDYSFPPRLLQSDQISALSPLRFRLHVQFYGGIIIIIIIIIIIKKILTITIGILHFVQEPLIIKAASSIKRGSCFEGIRVCFYGLGQPWFIADSETHRKWTTGWQNTHTQTHVQLFIDNYWSRESREQYYIDLRSFTLEILCLRPFSLL